MSLKATQEEWVSATANLQIRRDSYGHTNDNIHVHHSLVIYKNHIERCGYGNSVLDVGCGSQALKEVLRDGTEYIGVDAFPIKDIECIHSAIEDLKGVKADTVVAYAVLDNCREFDVACQSMKRIAQKNISILTGIDIEVDKFHTFKLQLSDFERNFSDWKCTVKEELRPKVWLLNYEKP